MYLLVFCSFHKKPGKAHLWIANAARFWQSLWWRAALGRWRVAQWPQRWILWPFSLTPVRKIILVVDLILFFLIVWFCRCIFSGSHQRATKCNLTNHITFPYKSPSDRNNAVELRYSIVFTYDEFFENKKIEFRACPKVNLMELLLQWLLLERIALPCKECLHCFCYNWKTESIIFHHDWARAFPTACELAILHDLASQSVHLHVTKQFTKFNSNEIPAWFSPSVNHNAMLQVCHMTWHQC